MSFVPIRSAHCSRAEWKKELYFFPSSGTLQSKCKLATRNKWSQLDSTRWLSWGGGAIASILTIGPRGPVLYPIKISLSLWARLQVRNEANTSIDSIHQGSNRSVCPRNLKAQMVTGCTQCRTSPTNQWIRMAVRNIGLFCLEAQQAHQQQCQSQFLLAFCFPSRSLAWQYDALGVPWRERAFKKLQVPEVWEVAKARGVLLLTLNWKEGCVQRMAG